MDRSPGAASIGAAAAARLDRRREQILHEFRDGLAGTRSPDADRSLSASDESRMVNGVVDDMVASFREYPAATINESVTRRSRGGPADNAGIASALTVLFEIVLLLVVAGIGDEGADAADFCAFSAITLNRSILGRSRELFARATTRPEPVGEEECRRLVRDLHDRLGNDIAAAIAALEGADNAAGRDRASTLMRAALDDVHGTIGSLRREPRVPDLGTSLREYLAADRPGGPTVQVRMSGDQAAVPAAARDELFLMVREAVRNAIRHANAAAITIDLTIGRDDVHVIVADDGVGVDTARAARRTGGGLVTMRERAEALGGALEIAGAPAGGTTVDIRIPLAGGRDEPQP